MRIIGATIATLHGFYSDILYNLYDSSPHDKEILRPPALRGQVTKVDTATSLTAAAASFIREKIIPHHDSQKVGVVIGTKSGNHQTAKQYADKIRRGATSPSLFSASGYSICAGLSALAAKINGPSTVIAGSENNWADCMTVASNYIRRNDAEMMLVGQVEVSRNGEYGVCGMIALAKDQIEIDALGCEVNFQNCDSSHTKTQEDMPYPLLNLPYSMEHLYECVETCIFVTQTLDSEQMTMPNYVLEQLEHMNSVHYKSHFGQEISVMRRFK